MSDGESYFVIVSGVNELGHHVYHRSDGITVKLEPPLPGNVRDGSFIGLDLQHQASTTTLSANWDGFGSDRENENVAISKSIYS